MAPFVIASVLVEREERTLPPFADAPFAAFAEEERSSRPVSDSRKTRILKKLEKMSGLNVKKFLLFSIRYCWESICQHPCVAALLLFMLFLCRYFPSIFHFIICSSPVIACTSLLLGALLVYGEPDNHEHGDTLRTSVRDRSVVVDALKKGEFISDENVKNRRLMSPFKMMSCCSDDEDIELDLTENVMFSFENPVGGLKVEIKKPVDNQFESSLGSPWQQVDSREASSDSESDGEKSSSSSDTSVTAIAPIIDELHPLLESENRQPAQRSADTSDAVSRDSSPERESEDDSAEEDARNRADKEYEEVQEEKDNNEAVVKWTADDQKNLMDLGSLELERNQRLENLIAKRRAKKLQRFQTDKNLIDLDTEPLPFMEEILRLNLQVPVITASRSNPFDLPFNSESSGLPPVPGSAPSVLLPRTNPFDLPFDQGEDQSRLTGESSKSYDMPISSRDTLLASIDRSNIEAASKDEAKLKPYFVAEKMNGTNYTSFERQSSEDSDSEGSSATDSDSASAVLNQDLELSSANKDTVSVDRESDLSVEVGSINLDQELDGTGPEEEDIREIEASSPVSSSVNLEVIDERYDGSSSSSYSEEEDDVCNKASIYIEPVISAHTVMSSDPMLSIVKPGLPGKGAEEDEDCKIETNLSAKPSEDCIQVADPVYDSSPSAMFASHIPLIDESLFSKVKDEESDVTGASYESNIPANLLEMFSSPKAFEKGANSNDEKEKGINEVSDDAIVAKIRDTKTVNEASDSFVNSYENFSSEDGKLELNDPKRCTPEPSAIDYHKPSIEVMNAGNYEAHGNSPRVI